MNNYYFTFGQNHVQTDGTAMKDYWIRVSAPDYSEARLLFMDRFTSEFMPARDKWAFQYEEKDFDPQYFPKGEYLFIKYPEVAVK